ncbi:BRANCHLESS TRICHOMES [Hibiscus trionum]|uniref:BRANCHLESS TRICHOMES n=1 Tax=Hibiscus trionum TaxID=183268 RepID=A0A9W7H604_HIBTR|nr:BRANCHLESS TRICHOMES [Hibiscus trionum]
MMKNRSTSSNLSNEISWYDNPFCCSDYHQQQHCKSTKHLHCQGKPVMDSESGIARAQIIDLKAEVDYERQARKKAESLNKKLAKEVAQERRGREELESVFEKLATEVTAKKLEIDRMKKEFGEERKMLKMAEALREERVQMKLADAKILFEEKVKELEEIKRRQSDDASNNMEDNSKEPARFLLSEKSSNSTSAAATVDVSSSMVIRRKASAEAENPHIKRGIKGFVEFPRVVRAIGSKSKHWGSKLECQKSQLRILPLSK